MKKMEGSQSAEQITKKKRGIRRMVSNSARIAGCVGIGVLGAAIDGPAIVGIAFIKSPIYFYKGFKVTFQAGYGPACTGAMACIWPVRVIGELGASIFYSVGKGFKGGFVAYEQKSFTCGFNHIISAIAEYDEYSNDVVLLREGSCLPRPAYRRRTPINEIEQEKNRLIVQKSKGGVTIAKEEIKLEGMFRFMSSTGIDERLNGVGLELRLGVEVVALLILWYLAEEFEFEFGMEPEGGFDALETLGQQMGDAELGKDEVEILEGLVLRKQIQFVDGGLENAIRRATLEAFGRRIRGIAGFLCADARFRKSFIRL